LCLQTEQPHLLTGLIIGHAVASPRSMRLQFLSAQVGLSGPMNQKDSRGQDSAGSAAWQTKCELRRRDCAHKRTPSESYAQFGAEYLGGRSGSRPSWPPFSEKSPAAKRITYRNGEQLAAPPRPRAPTS
jgi:hypothetical protein